MTAMLTRGRLEKAPTPIKIKGTLLDLVTPVEGLVYGEPGGLYSSLNCLPTDATTAMCPDARTSKTFGGISIVNGFRFAVYSGVTCQSLGLNWEDVVADLARVEALKESQAVERALMQTRFTGVAGGAAATDLTPAGGAVSPEVGLAILEGDAAVKYAGIATLHIPRTIASILMGDRYSMEYVGNALYSRLGNKVAAGAGYQPSNGPTGAAAPTGTMWMYASGEVGLQRSELIAPTYQVNMSTNDVVALVERVYVADVDCYVSAVKVNIV